MQRCNHKDKALPSLTFQLQKKGEDLEANRSEGNVKKPPLNPPLLPVTTINSTFQGRLYPDASSDTLVIIFGHQSN